MRFHRNTIVRPRTDGSHYGRILYVLPNGYYDVLDCGKHITRLHHDEIEADGYIGSWVFGRDARGLVPLFSHMTTIRKLKQISSGYNPDIWRKSRRRLLVNNPLIACDLASCAIYAIYDQGVRVSFREFGGKPFRDHNHYSRYLLHDVVVTTYKAMHKARSVRGRNWEILVSNDYTEHVEIRYGEVADILNDLIMIRLAGK